MTKVALRRADAPVDEIVAGYVDDVILGAIALTGARTPLLAAGPNAGTAMAGFAARSAGQNPALGRSR